MTYIGASESRVDGHAKVTGAAKYAGEFNAPGLAYGSVLTSPIARGHITHIDTSDALRVDGVIDVLTHEHRAHMAASNPAYKDDVAPEGAPFRPLYNNRILFSGQPIALVLADEWEIARYAASLIRLEYQDEAHVTDINRERGKAFTLAGDAFAMSLAKPRGDAGKALAATKAHHEAEYFIPVEHHNPMELYLSLIHI